MRTNSLQKIYEIFVFSINYFYLLTSTGYFPQHKFTKHNPFFHAMLLTSFIEVKWVCVYYVTYLVDFWRITDIVNAAQFSQKTISNRIGSLVMFMFLCTLYFMWLPTGEVLCSIQSKSFNRSVHLSLLTLLTEISFFFFQMLPHNNCFENRLCRSRGWLGERCLCGNRPSFACEWQWRKYL